MDPTLRFLKKFIPKKLFEGLQPSYHYLMAFLAAVLYRFPADKIIVIAITGTKGKSTSTEILSAIFEAAGHKTALSNTVRFKVGSESRPNLYKMSMPGRLFTQKFLRQAVTAGCTYAIIEITSEAARFHRHKFIELDGLIFTNLAPEHIESHGSYEKYLAAKLSIATSLARSTKKRRIIVANADDVEGAKFLNMNVSEKYPYSLTHAAPYTLAHHEMSFTLDGQTLRANVSGTFNLYNILGAATFAKTHGVSIEVIKTALEQFKGVRGRVERIDAGQNFTVIVDYAHTKESLESLYKIFDGARKIAVLGNTGGGRDKWKRPAMAKVAEQYCDEIILTNEDPYDEDPHAIVEEMRQAIQKKPVQIILDRREAIAAALRKARPGDVLLITGKGTDPYICGPNNSKLPWDDATVVREELLKIKN
ncbi:MAG: UDP-N-acetylmuramyl-tripeptide synthetase [Patescibacteria group bacterium]